ncbi:MAG: DUF4129 domain-containing protein [Caldilineaceae bacterium]|nr:DUF4129 domain-containing protein [Caldilineaceae bacterium]
MSPRLLLAQMNADGLPLAAYQTKLAAWQARLAENDTETAVAAVQREIAAIQHVTLPAGDVLTIQPLLGDPAEGAISPQTAQIRLAALTQSLAAATQDETAIRLALLESIFQRSEFVENDSLWQRFWRWLRSWLPTNESSADSGAARLPPFLLWLGWALIGIAAVLLVWLLSYWLQSLLGTFVSDGHARQPGDASGAPQSAAEARTAAHRLADAGSYREAVRQLYLSALLALHERHVITYHSSDTNREVLTAVRAQPQLYQQLQPVIATFDDVWYGVHEPDRASFDGYVDAVEKLEKLEEVK